MFSLSKFLRKSTLKLKQSVSKRPVHLQCHAYNSYGHTSKVSHRQWSSRLVIGHYKVTVTKRKKSEENKSTENSRKRKSNSRLNAFRKSASGRPFWKFWNNLYLIFLVLCPQLYHLSPKPFSFWMPSRPVPRHFGRVLTSGLLAHNCCVKPPRLQSLPHCIR